MGSSLMINSTMQIGFSGMRSASAGMAESSRQIAKGGNQVGEAGMPNQIKSMVSLKENLQLFDASAKVVKTSDQLLGTLLDLRV